MLKFNKTIKIFLISLTTAIAIFLLGIYSLRSSVAISYTDGRILIHTKSILSEERMYIEDVPDIRNPKGEIKSFIVSENQDYIYFLRQTRASLQVNDQTLSYPSVSLYLYEVKTKSEVDLSSKKGGFIQLDNKDKQLTYIQDPKYINLKISDGTDLNMELHYEDSIIEKYIYQKDLNIWTKLD